MNRQCSRYARREIRWRRPPPAWTLADMETTAAFRLSGNATLTAAAVTQRLGIEPTYAVEMGVPVSSRSAAIRQGSLWLLASSPAAETGTELAGHLHRLLVILEPATAPLGELVRVGYDANWLCYIAEPATEHAAELDRQTMQRVLALPGDIWLDVYGHDTV